MFAIPGPDRVAGNRNTSSDFRPDSFNGWHYCRPFFIAILPADSVLLPALCGFSIPAVAAWFFTAEGRQTPLFRSLAAFCFG